MGENRDFQQTYEKFIPKALAPGSRCDFDTAALLFTASTYWLIGGTVTLFFWRIQFETQALSAISQLSRISRPLMPSEREASCWSSSSLNCFAQRSKICLRAFSSGRPKCSCKSNRLSKAYNKPQITLSYRVQVLFAIGGTDQDASLRVCSILCQIAVIKSLQKAEKHREQTSCNFVHLIIVSTCHNAVNLLFIQPPFLYLINKDDAIIDFVAEFQNRIQTLLAFSVILVYNTLKRNVSNKISLQISYTKIILLS